MKSLQNERIPYRKPLWTIYIITFNIIIYILSSLCSAEVFLNKWPAVPDAPITHPTQNILLNSVLIADLSAIARQSIHAVSA